MTIPDERILEICTERLSSWAVDLALDHATPALLVGIGHDQNSGDVHLCMCENMPMEQMEKILRFALAEVEKKRAPAKGPQRAR